MPQTIARTIADLVSEASTEQEIRHTILTCIQEAEAGGYEPGSEDLFREVCEHLESLAAHEPNQEKRAKLSRATQIVCEIAGDG